MRHTGLILIVDSELCTGKSGALMDTRRRRPSPALVPAASLRPELEVTTLLLLRTSIIANNQAQLIHS